MRVRRPKPYVCIDCDFAEHFRFQETKDIEAAAGTWLRCLAYSRAQEQDGVIKASWLRRTFAATYDRVDELVAVGLLRRTEDGDYAIHAYAPRNQTRAMLQESRETARLRMAALRDGARERATPSASLQAPIDDRVRANKGRTNAFVPTSTSLSSDLHPLTEIRSSEEGGVQRGDAGNAGEAGKAGDGASRDDAVILSEAKDPTRTVPQDDRHPKHPLPSSERALSGPSWLAAFTEGISAATQRPCTAGRMYLGTLERIVTHHAPFRDAPRACEWLRDQAKDFASKWDGKHPAKGLTPDGLERWLNDGRRGPPDFGKERIVQLPAGEWTEDDFSDLGAEVIQ